MRFFFKVKFCVSGATEMILLPRIKEVLCDFDEISEFYNNDKCNVILPLLCGGDFFNCEMLRDD